MKWVLILAVTLCGHAAVAQQTAAQRQPWMMKGMDADVQAALGAWPEIMQQFPGMNAIRLTCVPGTDSQADIDRVIQLYTGAGVLVEAEDHSGDQLNTEWYQSMAKTYATNPLVYLETPNEPSGGNVAQNQITVIQAIRSAGFQNWVGIQPIGGYDQSNIPAVLAALGTPGLFVTPHIYDNSNDQNGAASYVSSEISQCKSVGLQCVIDEFGNATDGFTMDPQGNSTIMAVIAQNEAGASGALFWAMGNGYHADGADSACAEQSCQNLTSTGHNLIQPWLWGNDPTTGAGTAPPAAVPTQNLSAELTALGNQAGVEQQQNQLLEQAVSSKTSHPVPTTVATPQSVAPSQSAAAPPQEAPILPAVAGSSSEQQPTSISPQEAGASSQQIGQISATQATISSISAQLQQVQQELSGLQAQEASVPTPTATMPGPQTSGTGTLSPAPMSSSRSSIKKDQDGDQDDRDNDNE